MGRGGTASRPQAGERKSYKAYGFRIFLNGNITRLQRNGKTGGSFGLMDNLT